MVMSIDILGKSFVDGDADVVDFADVLRKSIVY